MAARKAATPKALPKFVGIIYVNGLYQNNERLVCDGATEAATAKLLGKEMAEYQRAGYKMSGAVFALVGTVTLPEVPVEYTPVKAGE